MLRPKILPVLTFLLLTQIACASRQGEPEIIGSASTVPALASVTPDDGELAVMTFESDLGPEPVHSEGDEDSAPVPEEPEPPPTAQENLRASLEAYETAETFWEEGGFDDALAALDRSYVLLGAVDANGDVVLAQQKDDLRRLVARRVLEIYASSRSRAGDLRSSIPLETNERIEREIRSFQGPERESFLAGYERSGLYRPHIVEKLREAGMPEELSWLPMVESWFKVRALSSARALGMWQFISSTGYRYGLKRTSWIDQRMDPEESTRAALEYLEDLHAMFGDWLTALASYNSGETRVRRLIEGQSVAYFDQFWDIYDQLPRETRRYVPRFLATVLIVNDPEAYGFTDLPSPLNPVDVEIATVERSVQLSALDDRLELSEGTLAGLNPELRHKALPDFSYELRVPEGLSEKASQVAASLPKATVRFTETHRVRRGETLSTIAEKYRTSVRSLMRLNGLRNPNRIWPGQKLTVDGTVSRAASSSRGGPAPDVYVVRRGDSLWRIASRYGLTVDRIRRENNLRSDALRPGQRLRLKGAVGPGGESYVVRSGDTLGLIADRHRIGLSRLLSANGLRRSSTIYPGQRLTIPQ